jgi:hypothetical protein
MVVQRKYRNDEERMKIREEIVSGAPPGLDISPFLIKVDEFVAAKDLKRIFEGEIEFPGTGLKVVYKLPGRRIISHFAKLTAVDKDAEAERLRKETVESVQPTTTTNAKTGRML